MEKEIYIHVEHLVIEKSFEEKLFIIVKNFEVGFFERRKIKDENLLHILESVYNFL